MTVDVSNNAVALAYAQLGDTYVWAAPPTWQIANPSSFDCSGLAGWCWYRSGVRPGLTHKASLQYLETRKYGTRSVSDAQPGDLIFYGPGGRTPGIYHVAICAGNGTLIEAPERGIPVRIRNYTPNDTDIVRNVGVYPGSKVAARTGSSGTKLIDLIHEAGFTGQAANIMYGIVMAESNGNPYAHNATPPDNSYGLSQVNMLGTLGPDRRAQFHLASNDDLYDPLTNLRVAYSLSSGGSNFTPWSTYNSGAYLAGMNGSHNEVINGGSGGGFQGLGSGVPISKGPYDEAKLKVPLTTAQRRNILAYLKSVNPNGDVTWLKGDGSDDGAMIQLYRASQGGTINADPSLTNKILGWMSSADNTTGNAVASVTDWATGLAHVISWLTNVDNWKRIGLFVLGAIILIFAVVETFKGTT